jgi:cobalt-zinc-cadmium efflux system membrane fusion protein
MRLDGRSEPRAPAMAVAAAALIGALLTGCGKTEKPAASTIAAPTDDRVELTASQLKTIDIQPVFHHVFSPERTAVGSIDFDEDRAVQVFSNYPGKIIQAFAEVGDDVAQGKPLYTIDSPDLTQAESNLIAAAGVEALTTRALERDRKLHEAKGIADKDLDQAISDQMTAEGNLRAARAAVHIFGKTDSEIDRIISARRIDPALVVRSPIAGRVTARAAQPGLLVQPGNSPAPFAVADVSTMWLIADVEEADSPMLRRGEPVRVKVMAFPDREFQGTISVVGAAVDPSVHTELVRADIRDPGHELRSGMLATYVIGVGAPVDSLAVPPDGVVRDGDGSMNVWVTTDDRHFTRRTVRIGQQQDGFDQILAGLGPDERVVTRGAVFLSNMANASAGD